MLEHTWEYGTNISLDDLVYRLGPAFLLRFFGLGFGFFGSVFGEALFGVFLYLRILPLIYYSQKILKPLKNISAFPLYLSKFQTWNISFMSAFSCFYS